MEIIWDETKNKKLQQERGISFEEIAVLILQKKYIEIVRHPQRPQQRIFLIPMRGYVYAVPFVIDDKKNLVLKTAFPSRKFTRLYGGADNENKT